MKIKKDMDWAFFPNYDEKNFVYTRKEAFKELGLCQSKKGDKKKFEKYLHQDIEIVGCKRKDRRIKLYQFIY